MLVCSMSIVVECAIKFVCDMRLHMKWMELIILSVDLLYIYVVM